MKAKYIGIVLLTGVILAGCGGGSSSTPGPVPLATIKIDSTNSSTVTAAAFASASLKVNSISPLGVQTTTTSSDDRILNSINDFAMKKIAEHQNSAMSVIGATGSAACDSLNPSTSGTMSYTSDGTGPSNSTYVTITFTNCKFSASSSTTINGTFSVTSYSITTNSQTATVSINLTVTTTGSSTIKYVGGYTLSATGVGTTTRVDTLTGSSLVFSVGTLNEVLSNFSFSSSYDDLSLSPTYSDTVNYTISSDFTGGSFTFTTIKPIVRTYGELYPHSGQAVIYGANSSALRVTILSTSTGHTAGTATGQLSLETSSDNGSNWTSLPTKMWSEL